MTEEDTFNKLKKWSYEDAIRYYWDSPGDDVSPTGWTFTELANEHQLRNLELPWNK
jgi:hypothetical protein